MWDTLPFRRRCVGHSTFYNEMCGKLYLKKGDECGILCLLDGDVWDTWLFRRGYVDNACGILCLLDGDLWDTLPFRRRCLGHLAF